MGSWTCCFPGGQHLRVRLAQDLHAVFWFTGVQMAVPQAFSAVVHQGGRLTRGHLAGQAACIRQGWGRGCHSEGCAADLGSLRQDSLTMQRQRRLLHIGGLHRKLLLFTLACLCRSPWMRASTASRTARCSGPPMWRPGCSHRFAPAAATQTRLLHNPALSCKRILGKKGVNYAKHSHF